MGDAPVSISSRERVYFPDSGHTKGDLANYCAAIAPQMLRFAANRLLSIVRCPQGRSNKCFFQRHLTEGFGPHVLGVSVREKDGTEEDYIYVRDVAGLLECVQMGTIEFHLWGSHVGDVEQPDRLVIDLDPGPGVAFADVRMAAVEVRGMLRKAGLESFPLLTGGSGIHVVVPLDRGHSWDRHGAFARNLAKAMEEEAPDRFTASSSKAKRKGRIFIDYLRNMRGNSAIAPYSVRARSGAPVAAPVGWDELPEFESAAAFSISDERTLISRAESEMLSGWGTLEQELPQFGPY
jgi:bifunctional non-homologous end joining protein LigD